MLPRYYNHECQLAMSSKQSLFIQSSCTFFDVEPEKSCKTGGVYALLGKTCATTQKNVKSHVFFLDFEKKRKKRKK